MSLQVKVVSSVFLGPMLGSMQSSGILYLHPKACMANQTALTVSFFSRWEMQYPHMPAVGSPAVPSCSSLPSQSFQAPPVNFTPESSLLMKGQEQSGLCKGIQTELWKNVGGLYKALKPKATGKHCRGRCDSVEAGLHWAGFHADLRNWNDLAAQLCRKGNGARSPRSSVLLAGSCL